MNSVMKTLNRSFLTLLSVALLQSCNLGVSSNEPQVQLSLRFGGEASAIFHPSVSHLFESEFYELPPSLCYVVHVTGEGINLVPPKALACGPEVGVGLYVGAFSVGVEFSLSVSRGIRRFDLLGYQSPKGADQRTGMAICEPIQIVWEEANGFKVPFATMFGEKINQPILFGLGMLDVGPDSTIVDLYAVPKVPSELVSNFLFGAPYHMRDYPNPPLACLR